MSYRRVRLYQFRNLVDTEIDVAAPEVFLIGENGQGKTNFIEAIYLLSFASSFRTRKEQTLIRTGAEEAALTGWLSGEGSTEETVFLRLGGAKREIRLNGKVILDRKELIEHTPCIVFCHDDIEFVRGAPDMQRWFFNQTLSLYDSGCIDRLRTYSRILRLRNAALKNIHELGTDSETVKLLDVYDEQLAGAGIVLREDRQAAVEAFNQPCATIFRRISLIQEDLVIHYQPSWKNETDIDRVVEHLRRRRAQDVRFGTTTSGPHRDRFQFRVGKREFTQFASTGQLRLMSLILRVAQARFYAERTGRKPVLLLDDVLLELDRERRIRFFAELPVYDQAFFTFLPDEQFSAYRKRDTLVYRVEAGTLNGTSG